MRRVTSSVSDIVIRFRSGRPYAIAETPNPLTQTASKPQRSMSSALMASWAPTATTGAVRASPARRACRLRSARFTVPRVSDDELIMGYFLLEASCVTGLDQLEDP